MSYLRPKLLIILPLVLFVLGVLYFLFKNSSFTAKNNTSKITIITSLFPLYDFAKNIGQDKVDVKLLLPFGTEAHSFDPKPSDIININQSDIFIYTGEKMEPWVKNIISGLTNQNLTIINASSHINIKSLDPHVWLDFDNAKIIIDDITATLVQKDPLNQSFYKLNSQEYKQKISNLDEQYRVALSDCQTNQIIYGGHYAFGYLASRYNLQYSSAQGISPDSEPTVSDLASLVNQVRQNNLKYIFYEEISSPKIAQTLASETAAQLLSLNSAHNISKQQFDNGISYISILQQDLVNLKLGLNCQ